MNSAEFVLIRVLKRLRNNIYARYMKAIPYKTASKQFERFTQFYFFAILLSS